MFDVRGFGWVWVGLGHGSISSPGSGLGWVGSVIWWVGLGWVDENRPTDNSALCASVTAKAIGARNPPPRPLNDLVELTKYVWLTHLVGFSWLHLPNRIFVSTR